MGEWLIIAGIVVGLATALYWVSKPEEWMNGSMDASVAALVAKLAADESWQDHLDEGERKMLLNWARQDMGEALEQRFTQCLGRMRTVNATSLRIDELEHFSSGGFSKLEIIKAIVGMRE